MKPPRTQFYEIGSELIEVTDAAALAGADRLDAGLEPTAFRIPSPRTGRSCYATAAEHASWTKGRAALQARMADPLTQFQRSAAEHPGSAFAEAVAEIVAERATSKARRAAVAAQERRNADARAAAQQTAEQVRALEARFARTAKYYPQAMAHSQRAPSRRN